MKKIISLLFMLFFSFGIFAITDKQKSDLLFMYQEEKLARDVYTALSRELTWSSFFVTLLRLFYAVYLFSNGVSPFNEECGLLEL